jgi:signal transduction histidine kinase
VPPDRDKTDASLRSERVNADKALAERLTDLADQADEVVDRARERADVVLDTARERADDERDAAGGHAAIARQRELADEVLEGERNEADERLRLQRQQYAQSLVALLPLERAATDGHLMAERVSADGALANRDDFMSMVGHDLRNLLNTIGLIARLQLEGASETDEGRKAVAASQRIERLVSQMNRLLVDLVDVVSIDAGKLAVLPARGDVSALLFEAVEMFAPVAANKGVSLKEATAAHGCFAEFDHGRMLQVLENLIGNALKFTPRGGEIVVRAEQAENEIHLFVTDTGEGIPRDKLEAIFERFEQVRVDDPRGRGLGLYISKCIVDAHGGKIWAESELGAGSAFHVTIPGLLAAS